MDYAEEQKGEMEALLSIYEGELEGKKAKDTHDAGKRFRTTF